jgi:tetratricopeptide (TPR) repeat protein
MPGIKVPLIVLSLILLASPVMIFKQEETYDLSSKISTLSALWAGDLEGDRVSEILGGGIIYEESIAKGVLVIIRRNEVSTFRIPSTSRTLVLTAGNVIEGGGMEIVVGSNGLYAYSKSGRLLKEKNIDGDVTALEVVDFDETPLNEIIFGTSAGNVVCLVDFEQKYQFSMGKTVRFIFHREEDTFYVVTSHAVSCRRADGEEIWTYSAAEEIRSAVPYDINNDAKKELVYISGSTINWLSFDGKKETTILTLKTNPLSLLVREVTGDEKPDLIVANSADHVVIYSDLTEETQSISVKRAVDESPILYAADITADGKEDLIYGGMAGVWVYENVAPPQDLMPRAQQLFFQGEELFKQREYQKALTNFEEAESIFSQLGEEEWGARCQEYISKIRDITDTVYEAETALAEGRRLYSEEKYQEAISYLETAEEAYAVLAEKDSFYESFRDEAQTLIVTCELVVEADSYYQSGLEYFDTEQYEKAKEQFQNAKAIYSELDSEKAQLCDQKLQEIEDLQKEVPEEEERDILVYVGAGAVVVVLMGAFLATRKKVSAKLEKGHIYLLHESSPKKGLQLVKEYGRLGYDGLVITRQPIDQIRKKKLKKQKVLQFSSATKEDSIAPDNVVNILLRMKEFMTSRKNSILLLDGLDYITIQNTFEDAFSLIQKLAESVTLYKGIVLVSLNPKSLEEKELVLLEGEMELLEF